jgi:hypothetical protein
LGQNGGCDVRRSTPCGSPSPADTHNYLPGLIRRENSGGPVFYVTDGDSQALAIGIHWGTASVFSPLYSVIDEMEAENPSIGVTDPVGSVPPYGPANTVSGPSVVKSGSPCIWKGYIYGGASPYFTLWIKNGSTYRPDVRSITT